MGRIEEKRKLVEEIREKIKGAKSVMVANIDGVPCDLMNKIREALRGKAFIKVVKKRILLRALEGTEAEPLAGHVKGSPAIILSDEDIFDIFKEIRAHVAHAPLKPGKEAPVDVVVQPGPTGLPAPMLGEIKSAGLPVRVNKGVIEIEKEEVVVKKGEKVPPQLANVLLMLNIKPVRKELYVLAGMEDGVLYTRDVLSLDADYVVEMVQKAHGKAIGLSLASKYPVKQTVAFFVSDAHSKAVALAVSAGILTKETAKHLLSTAVAKARALSRYLSGEAPAEEQEEKEESPKEEEPEEKEEESTAGLAALFG